MRYEWQCKRCKAVVEVERKLKDYKVPPSKEEGRHQIPGTAEDSPYWEGKEHEWERVLGVPSTPFQHLRHAGVFADEHGNYAPWSRNL